MNKLSKFLSKLKDSYTLYEVFNDFIEIVSASLSNSYDKIHFEERENKYMEIIKRYNTSELDSMASAFSSLIIEMESSVSNGHLKDILGDTMQELDLCNERNGQIFTPPSISKLMSQLLLSNNIKKSIEENGYVSILEPAVGSGVMVLSFAETMKALNYNYQSQLFAGVIDKDRKSALINHIQLSLYNIPAVIIWGNTLSGKEYERWYTPNYVLNNWVWRRNFSILGERSKIDELLKMSLDPKYAIIRNIFGYKENTSNSSNISNDETRKNGSMYFDIDFGKELLNISL